VKPDASLTHPAGRPGKAFVRSVLLALVLAATAGEGFAQFGGGMGGGRRGLSNASSSRSTDASSASPVSVANQAADKLYDLRTRLLITPEQGPLWEVFYARTLAVASDLARSQSAPPDLNAVQLIQWRLAVAQSRAALLDQLSTAVQSLYASLTPDQQRTADQYLPAAVPGLDADAAARGGLRRSPG
jgi:hypothetical protein